MDTTPENIEKTGQQGIAAVELAVILPILLVIAFAVIDFGRLIQARIIVANVSREGGSLASRDLKSGADLCTLLQTSARPLEMQNLGKIFINRVRAGASQDSPEPYIDVSFRGESGNLTVANAIRTGAPNLGLSRALYVHLIFDPDPAKQTSDLAYLTIVEVYYKYRPITPLPQFVQNLLLRDGDGMIIGSKSVF